MNNIKDFNELVNFFIDMLLLLVPLIFGATLLVITWGVLNAWVISAGDETKIQTGKHTALIGVIALVVMSGVWGILAMLQSSLGLSV